MRMPPGTAARTAAAIMLDTGYTAAVAWLMWWNAGTTVADLPGIALAVIVITGGAIITIRQLVAVRPRHGLADPRSIRSERTVVVAHVTITAGLVTAWHLTGIYLLGWFATFAVAALLVSSVLMLLTDVATRTIGAGGRRGRSSARRPNQIEWFHATGAVLGFIGLVVTASVHTWDPYILNLTVVLITATLIAGALTTNAIRSRQTPPTTAH